MRTQIFIMLIVLISGTFGCQNNTDLSAEKEAIKAVNKKQLDAMESFDYEGEAAVWLHEPYIHHAGFGEEEIRGWDSLSVHYKEQFENMKQDSENRISFSAENFDVIINGNIAILSYDESSEGTLFGEEFSNKGRAYKYLMKKDGEWKILAVL